MKTLGRLSLVLGIMIVAVVAGCGSDNGGAFNVGGPTGCGTVSACGGDLVGTWQVTTGCVTAAGIKSGEGDTSECPAASLAVTGINVSGTFSFNADMTYTATALAEQATYRIAAPVSCVTGGSCASGAASLQSNPEFESASCSGTSTCVCTAVQVPIGGSDSGTYTISGTTLITSSALGGSSTNDYCVQGSNLHLMATDATMSMGPMGQATIDEDTVAQKQ